MVFPLVPKLQLGNKKQKICTLHHYSIHTERSYVGWIVRFVWFRAMRPRADLFPAEPRIEAFLTDLAVNEHVAAATQNQAMNALVFLYKRFLNHSLEGCIDAVRARQEDQCPRGHDARRSRQGHFCDGWHRAIGGQTALREPPLLQNHPAGIRTLHQQDSAQGYGEVYLPHALARKYPHAPKEWGREYVFPARAPLSRSVSENADFGRFG
ncbi:MAG: site-specific integrase [Thermodesulfobacteriota bacterium]|nr:site-specific integrase [Thermodesulfobacteriota bacterium]